MRGTLTTAFLVLAVTLVAATAAWAEEGPTREEYVAKVDPICQKNTEAKQTDPRRRQSESKRRQA